MSGSLGEVISVQIGASANAACVHWWNSLVSLLLFFTPWKNLTRKVSISTSPCFCRLSPPHQMHEITKTPKKTSRKMTRITAYSFGTWKTNASVWTATPCNPVPLWSTSNRILVISRSRSQLTRLFLVILNLLLGLVLAAFIKRSQVRVKRNNFSIHGCKSKIRLSFFLLNTSFTSWSSWFKLQQIIIWILR